MKTEPHFPTVPEMKRQYPLVRALVEKDLVWGDLEHLFSSLIRLGIFFFILFSVFALGMRDSDFSDGWSQESVTTLALILGFFFLFFVTFGFMWSVNYEALQGTFRTLSLYPIGIGSITTSKLGFMTLVVGAGTVTIMFSTLLPFLIMDVISLRIMSYYMVMTVLFFLAFLLCSSAGAYYANISAAKSGKQSIASFSFLGLVVAALLSYWPVFSFLSVTFAIFDHNERFVGPETANILAWLISHLSPLDMAFHFGRHYILGIPLDPGYLICIPVWFYIAFQGIKTGPRVYMDVFFRRG